MPDLKMAYSAPGYCPICESKTTFTSKFGWYRGHLVCQTCKSVPRERALATIVDETFPAWRNLSIHECSPGERGISPKLRRECTKYVGSHYFPDKPFGTLIGAHRNENLEHQTFDGGVFDLVVTLDVMEHLFDPAEAYREIYRTLKYGGAYIHTFPIKKEQVEAVKPRARISQGTIEHIEKPEYHGNPIDPTNGALVTVDYGYDVHQQIRSWAPFDVRVTRFCEPTHGILGEFTEVIVCRKN
jgi:SAM-dependent methyltransferase